MPRPTPLSDPSNPYPRFDTLLTPRTPHSRAGRAEESYSTVELEQIDLDADEDYGTALQQQNAPLLSSSASDSFPPIGYRSRGNDYDDNAAARKDKRPGLTAEKIIARLPLALYSSVAAILLVLVFFSLREPETLKKYVGVTESSAAVSAGQPQTTPAVDLGTTPLGTTLISYENYTSFPLDPIEYRAECIKLNSGVMPPMRYWAASPPRDVPHEDEQPGYKAPSGPPICSRTITYQLDGWAGLMADLALIAQTAALARERGATFFVDDRFWNRGKWTDHFVDIQIGQPGPEPGCRPPPPQEYVACPRTARHWIVNSRTSRYHFTHAFNEKYEDPYAHSLNRMRNIFNFAWQSFENVIRPNDQSARLIQQARSELQEKVIDHYQNPRSFKGFKGDGPVMGYIGVHIRRGDRSPAWTVYGQQYLPLSEYLDGVVDSWSRLGLELSPDNNLVQPFVYIASDSPQAEKEFAAMFSPERVSSLSRSRHQELRALASPGDYYQDDFMKLPRDIQVQATRGMIVDFAVLSGAWSKPGHLIPDATVCAISSVVCKLSAIGLGWKRAFGNIDDMGEMDKDSMRWVEIDLKGRVVPVWEALQAF
ncbi:hypothetical protein C8F04DRAFT_969001 [Mycena alexandri]|uniref:Uncharacterized protein n=1 Tax=Mycena alexandri TaxID=1745969 RepID=A0AAD6SAS6_9AGAR|nr:hypothetical protein C8F04DRAFT_969001 [Mycena alexandri]